MFGSSLLLVVCRRALIYVICVCLCSDFVVRHPLVGFSILLPLRYFLRFKYRMSLMSTIHSFLVAKISYVIKCFIEY